MNKLSKRILTAVFLGVLLIGSLLWDYVVFIFFLSVILSFSSLEYFSMIATEKFLYKKRFRFVVLIMSLSVFFLVYIFHRLYWVRIFLLVFVILHLLWLLRDLYDGDMVKPNIWPDWLAPAIYIGLSFSCIHFLAHPAEGEYFPQNVLAIFFFTWMHDIAAFFIGSRIGTRPLFPRVSPKKTWEGFFGGLFFTVVIAVLMSYSFWTYPLWVWIGWALVVSIAATLGDLCESKCKRIAGIKDSGRWMPGHGGFLDRFDGFIFALPFSTVYIMTVGEYFQLTG